MNSLRHRNPLGASRESGAALHAFRLGGLPALAHAEGFPPELTMRARWSSKTQSSPSPLAMARPHKSFWLQGFAGLLAFGALAFGIFMASNDTCTQGGSAASGSYSQSTLAPITATGSASPSLRDSSCKRKHGRPGQLKTAP